MNLMTYFYVYYVLAPAQVTVDMTVHILMHMIAHQFWQDMQKKSAKKV